MNEENVEMETPENQNEVEDAPTPEEEATPEVAEPVDDKELKSALAQKDHYREKFEKAEADRKALEAKLNASANGNKAVLDVEDYIDISASLEGLDQREKERLAREHKLTGRPLNEIRQDEDFALWQKAYRDKVEKEQSALNPSGTQSMSDKPASLVDTLKKSSMEEKEALLKEKGLYKEFRPRADRQHIGNQGLR